MTDEFDVELRERLALVASAVPVDVRAPAPAAPVTRVRPSWTTRRTAAGVMPILAIVVIGTLIVGIAKVGPFAPGGTPSAAAGTPPRDLAVHVINLDRLAIEVVLGDDVLATVGCGVRAEIASDLLDPGPPWDLDVRATSGDSIATVTVDGPLPQAILLRDGAALTGPWPMSYGPEPVTTCTPTEPDGSVLGVASDDALEVTVRAAHSVYVEGEPIDLRATLRYIGSDVGADYTGGIWFYGTQVDGSRSFRFLGAILAMCVRSGFVADLPIEEALAERMPRARSLPAGDWRITAQFDGNVPSCLTQGKHRDVRASVDIRVVPGLVPSRPIPLLTTAEPSDATSTREFCSLAQAGGELAVHPQSGLGLAGKDGSIQPIRWPSGFTAQLLPDGAVLYNKGGQILARAGDSMRMPGGPWLDGVFTVCGAYWFP